MDIFLRFVASYHGEMCDAFFPGSPSRNLVAQVTVGMLKKGIGPVRCMCIVKDVWECYAGKRLEALGVM